MRIIDYGQHFDVTIEFNNFFRRNLGLVKSLPEKEWVHAKKVWRVPARLRPELTEVATICKARIEVYEAQAPQTVGAIDELPMPDYEIAVSNRAPGAPRNYQKQGIARGIALRRFINGDDMGLGKTFQSILTLATAYKQGQPTFPCLIICPSSLKENWKREVEMWTDHKAIILTDSIKQTFPQYWQVGMAQFFIVNYESLKKYFVAEMPSKKKGSKSKDIVMHQHLIDVFKSVIADESHKCKDVSALQSKLTLRIAHRKEWVVLLTGTPVKNRPSELFPQLAIMGHLQQFGGRSGFLNRYCEGGKGSANLQELNYLLNKHCYFRREKKDVLKDLPDKQRQKIICEISTREEYEFAKRSFERWMEDNGMTDSQISRAMRAEILVQMGKLRAISARGKMAEVREFVEEVMDAGDKLVLFCNLKEIVQTLHKMFPKAVTIVGGQDMATRQRNIDAFQNDPELQLIICNIQAAGVGITLTASSRVAFVEFPWTYADAAQCEDRCYRLSQKNAVMCSYFLGNNTIDEKLFDLIMSKKDIHAQITGATDDMEMDIVDKLLDLFKK